MKRNTARAFSMLAVLALATAAGYAQAIKANVPFEFTVGKKTFPAGEYVIRQFTPDTLVLSSKGNGLSTLVMPQAVRSLDEGFNPRLKFAVNDGRSVLSEIWVSGDEGYKLSVPKAFLAVAQNSAESTVVRASLAPAK